MTLQLSVRSQVGDVVRYWASAGLLAGIGLGGVYGGILGLAASAQSWALATFIFGCAAGVPIGATAGIINGLSLGLLAEPLRLNSGNRSARVRGAAVAGAVTGILLLIPVLVVATAVPLAITLPPVIASVLVAGAVALRVPPAGRPADQNAFVRVQTL